MMKVVFAQESHNPAPTEKSIFLAGPSPRGREDFDWRREALDALRSMLRFEGTVYVPLPRDGVYHEDYDAEAQIRWEQKYLAEASVVVFWIPRDLERLPGFTTNVEFGQFVKSGKIAFGAPVDAPKMRFLRTLAQMHGVSCFASLNGTLYEAIDMLKR